MRGLSEPLLQCSESVYNPLLNVTITQRKSIFFTGKQNPVCRRRARKNRRHCTINCDVKHSDAWNWLKQWWIEIPSDVHSIMIVLRWIKRTRNQLSIINMLARRGLQIKFIRLPQSDHIFGTNSHSIRFRAFEFAANCPLGDARTRTHA